MKVVGTKANYLTSEIVEPWEMKTTQGAFLRGVNFWGTAEAYEEHVVGNQEELES